jgi:hypothetical protein
MVTARVIVAAGLAICVMADAAVGRPSGGATIPPDQRRAILEKGLASFEAAVAEGRHGSPTAQTLYREAAGRFESLIRSGVRNGRLCYNLANTYVRLGEIGRAIVYYRRAQRHMPGDDRIAQNLDFARGLCEIRFQRPATSAIVETLLFWHFRTSVAGRTLVALGGYILFWLVALGMRRLSRRVAALNWILAVIAVVTLCTAASVGHDRWTASKRFEGVIVADDVTLRKGGGEYYDPQFDRSFPQGVEFQILEARPDVNNRIWYRVELPDGKDGWLPADQAEIINPPDADGATT